MLKKWSYCYLYNYKRNINQNRYQGGSQKVTLLLSMPYKCKNRLISVLICPLHSVFLWVFTDVFLIIIIIIIKNDINKGCQKIDYNNWF